MSGKKFSMLLAVNQNGKRANGNITWNCICDCGKSCTVDGHDLRSGKAKSCGCSRSKWSKEAITTHGMRYTKIYKTWEAMKRRCSNPNAERYKNYGGRGVRVCSEWIQFAGFYRWALQSEYREDLSIERIDVNGNYEPNNCTWIPVNLQCFNKTNSRKFECQGKLLTIAEWSSLTHIPYAALYQRIVKLKWTPERAIKESSFHGKNQYMKEV